MNQLLEEKYKELGISEKVYAFGEKIEQELKERFEKIDFSNHHVFRRWNDPDVYFDQSASYGKYRVGNSHSGSI